MAGLGAFIDGFVAGRDVRHGWDDRKRRQKIEDEALTWDREDRTYTKEERARRRKEEDRILAEQEAERQAARDAYDAAKVDQNATHAAPIEGSPRQIIPTTALDTGAGGGTPLTFGSGIAPMPDPIQPPIPPVNPIQVSTAGAGLPISGPAGGPIPAQDGRMIYGPAGGPVPVVPVSASPSPVTPLQHPVSQPRSIDSHMGMLPVGTGGYDEWRATALPGPAGARTITSQEAARQMLSDGGAGAAASQRNANEAGIEQNRARSIIATPAPGSVGAAGGPVPAVTGGKTSADAAKTINAQSNPALAAQPGATPGASPSVLAAEATAPTKAKTPRVAFGINSPITVSTQNRDKAVKSFMESYLTVGVPKMVEYYAKTGQIDKAQAFDTWAKDEKTKSAIAEWSHGVHAAAIGDERGMLDSFAKYYNTFNDGLTVIRGKSGLTRDKDGNVVGVKLTFRDDQTGQEFSQTLNGGEELLQQGIYALAPEKMFEVLWDQMKSAQEIEAAGLKSDADIVEAVVKASGGKTTQERVAAAMKGLTSTIGFADLPPAEKAKMVVAQIAAEDQAAATIDGGGDLPLDEGQ